MSMSGMGSCNIQLDSVGFSMILRLRRFYAYSSSFTKTVGTTGTVLIEYASGYALPSGGTLDNFDLKSTWLNPGIESKLLAESITETSSIANASKFFFSLYGLKQITWNNIKTILNSLYQSVLVSGTNIKTINSESILGAGNIDLVKGPASSTDNAIPRFDGTTGKLLQTGGSITNLDTGEVGIGTETPLSELGIYGTTPAITLQRGNITSSSDWQIKNNVHFQILQGYDTATPNAWQDPYFHIAYDTGNVGIGTITPTEKLDINGNIKSNLDVSSKTKTIDSAVQMSYDSVNEELKFTFL
jgi:hypothetical protein